MNNEINTPNYYDNSKGSLYQFAENQKGGFFYFNCL